VSYDIQLDMDDLHALASDLATVIDEFESANGNADAAAEATGSRELKDKVSGFASSWEIRRGKMIDDIKSLQQTIQMIAENFEAADADMAKALEESAEDPPAPSDYRSPQAV